MSLCVPDWLDGDFVRNILRCNENDDSLKIINLISNAAVDAGENYGSALIRSNIEYSTQGQAVRRKSWIFKISLMNENLKKAFEESFLFNTEIKMLTSTLKKMEEMLRAKSFCLKPKVVYTETGKTSMIVMEDLAPLGFRTVNRRIGLDLDHALLSVRRLAAFHATSVALYEKNPEEVTSYVGGICNKSYAKSFKGFFCKSLKNLAAEIATWSELGSRSRKYVEAFMILSEKSYDKAADELRPKENEFKVLNHGDYWTANQLFNYDHNGKIVDHIFIDFQLSIWSSPVVDLIYVTNTSLSEDVDFCHSNHLVEEYLSNLIALMKELNCTTQPPSLDELKKAFVDRAMYEMVVCTVILPTLRLDKKYLLSSDNEIFSTKHLAKTPFFKDIAFRNKIIRKLPYWESVRIFDV